MLAASECVVLSRWTCAEKGDHRTTLQGCPLERQRCAMAAFSGLLSLLWSGRAQGSEGRGARSLSEYSVLARRKSLLANDLL